MKILWDFDGTLFDTYPAYTEIVKEAIGDTNITDKEIFAQLKFFHRCLPVLPAY
ncbi:hypothetical protein NCCP133_26140 [Cytobacillus sp. NCCP-133]|nr:hypothetical protein NCCP133_26140 [Cytobacillus sp. NCCP-133]